MKYARYAEPCRTCRPATALDLMPAAITNTSFATPRIRIVGGGHNTPPHPTRLRNRRLYHSRFASSCNASSHGYWGFGVFQTIVKLFVVASDNVLNLCCPLELKHPVETHGVTAHELRIRSQQTIIARHHLKNLQYLVRWSWTDSCVDAVTFGPDNGWSRNGAVTVGIVPKMSPLKGWLNSALRREFQFAASNKPSPWHNHGIPRI